MARSRLVHVALLISALLPACAILPLSPRRGETLEPQRRADEEALRVQEVDEPIVVAAWAEPRELPSGGGQAQILIRVQKRGGARFPGVEARLRTSAGTLFSGGRTLVTDAEGMTRDRLTTHRSAVVTLNAGGTRYRFQVPVGQQTGEQGQ